MFGRSLLSFASPRRRRLFAALALVAYVASVVGFPLPLPAVSQDTSTPYPCQDHACGCLSAEQCWESCCCFSPAERLAWAREHGVRIPAAALARLVDAARDEQQATKTCCHRSDACSHDCHDAKSGRSSAKPTKNARHGVRWLSGLQAQKCQGLTTLWLVSGANLPVEIRSLWEFDWTAVDHLVVADDELLARHSRASPPPAASLSGDSVGRAPLMRPCASVRESGADACARPTRVRTMSACLWWYVGFQTGGALP